MSVCDDHQALDREPCPQCGTRFPVWTEQRCDTCGFAKRLPVEPFVLTLSPVVGFLANEGIDVLTPTFTEIIELLQQRVETTVTEDPFRLTVTIEGEAETLSVSLDGDLTMVDIDRRASD